MDKKKGFTLIELLVVIAIIALLMSILMPALSKVRKQAMSVSCLARLKQWGVIFSMYAGGNDGYLNQREVGSHYEKLWHLVYKPMYKDPMMRYCPTAINNKLKTGPFATWWADELGSWDPEEFPVPGEGDNQVDDPATGVYQAPTGSYGMNRYIEDMRGGDVSFDAAYWRKIDVRGGDKAPVMLDCLYIYYWSNSDASPPAYNGDYTTPEMHWITIDRHMGYNNVVFLDSSARKVGLKELYTLNHTKPINGGFDICGPWTICGFSNKSACKNAWDDAAEWMVKMPVY
ncbi:MAG: type II secretion system protein [Phycisphaerae bacterium]|nr:type II secretion system protein [Phycisphaerae bacterium]MDD5381933.1 type II secretion system protein [Phycisphaerae bacterium]